MGYEEKKRAELRLRDALREAGALRDALEDGDKAALKVPLQELEEALQSARKTLWEMECSGALSWTELKESAESAFRRIERHLSVGRSRDPRRVSH